METRKTVDIPSLLRWIVFLPAAALAGFLAYTVAWFTHEWAFGLFIGSGTLFGGSLVRFFSYLYMGIATVYAACFVAPSSKKIVAVITGGLVLVISGATMFYALSVPEYWGIVDSIAIDLGAIGVAIAIYNGQTELT